MRDQSMVDVMYFVPPSARDCPAGVDARAWAEWKKFDDVLPGVVDWSDWFRANVSLGVTPGERNISPALFLALGFRNLHASQVREVLPFVPQYPSREHRYGDLLVFHNGARALIRAGTEELVTKGMSAVADALGGARCVAPALFAGKYSRHQSYVGAPDTLMRDAARVVEDLSEAGILEIPRSTRDRGDAFKSAMEAVRAACLDPDNVTMTTWGGVTKSLFSGAGIRGIVAFARDKVVEMAKNRTGSPEVTAALVVIAAYCRVTGFEPHYVAHAFLGLNRVSLDPAHKAAVWAAACDGAAMKKIMSPRAEFDRVVSDILGSARA